MDVLSCWAEMIVVAVLSAGDMAVPSPRRREEGMPTDAFDDVPMTWRDQ
jgi:hypothetical protein